VKITYSESLLSEFIQKVDEVIDQSLRDLDGYQDE
jgi:hypothetical protein